jgi:hypothetical protein
MAFQLHSIFFNKCTSCGLYYHPNRAVEMQSRKMDNRGSKSTILNCMIVKEQRVDGSWFFNPRGLKNLRCTLRGFEMNTWAGIPSNQILNKRLYSTTRGSLLPKNQNPLQSFDPSPNLSKKEGSFILNPWFVTGFTDGDGSFAVSITKKKSGIGWKILPMLCSL